MPRPGFDDFYQELASFLSTDVAARADELWSVRAASPETMREVRKARADGYGRLVKILASYQALTEGVDASGPGEVKTEILTRLGLWFCSYFLGFPLPHVWERVRHLESVQEGYIGSGALYDKLAGDIYRAGRKIRERHRRHPVTAEPGPEEPILVLAYSPTLLIADEDLKGPITVPEPSPYNLYVSQLEKLAGRYLRLQMWLCLTSGEGVMYAFQLESAAGELARQTAQQAGAGMDREMVRNAVEVRRDRMLGDGHDTWLYGIPPHLLEGELFPSCTLGRHDGVMADRRQIQAGLAKQSTWVRSQYLELEREKMFNLLFGQKTCPADPAKVKPGITCGEAAVDELLLRWERAIRAKPDEAPGTAPSTQSAEATEGAPP
jgi:hypothetical protein